MLGSQHLRASSTPILYEVLWEATKMVDCPNEGFDTVYDEWLNSSQKMYNNVSKPLITRPVARGVRGFSRTPHFRGQEVNC